MTSQRVIEEIKKVYGNADEISALEKRVESLRLQLSELGKNLVELNEALGLLSVVSRIHKGVPLVIRDTTADGGTWISVHRLDYVKGGNRYAKVAQNVRTFEWMLSISGPGLRSGGEIVRTETSPAALIEVACEWVVGS